jgi:NAD(P)-dependent dehydrogenase (short-subunit alcohol dehydrogenase family)
MTGATLRFDGQVAIVTGAGRGLGLAYAELLASRGAAVVVNDVAAGPDPSVPAAEAAAERIRRAGGRAVADTSSVATPEGGAAIVDTAMSSFGSVDVVVNNAGIIRRMAFDALDLEALDDIITVNLKGAVHVTRAAWSQLTDRGGRIVNATSAAGVLGNREAAAYGATKAAIIGLTKVLALEGAAHGVRANALAPRALTGMSPPDTDIAWSTDDISPALVAPAAAFLAHESCPLTGETITATGGHVARFFTAVTRGYYDPAPTPESVRDHLPEIMAEQDYLVLREPAEERAMVQEVLRRGTVR